MTKGKAGLLAVLGAIFGIAVMAIFVVPKLNGPTAGNEVSTLTPDTTESDDAAATAPGATADAEDPSAENSTEMAAADPKSSRPVAAPEPVIPSFDILRVEPDGSTVIAGKGTPGSKLEILSGEEVIATTEIGSSGDFAVVLDTPLAAGDYELTLKTSSEGGASQVSKEVATVSIPEDSSGALLAMVTEPGEASRILTQPEAPAETSDGTDATDDDTEMAAAQAGTEASSSGQAETAEAGAPEETVGTGTAEAKAEATTEEPAPVTAAAEESAPEIKVAAADPADAPSGGAAGLPGLPDAALEMAATAPQIGGASSETDMQAGAMAEPGEGADEEQAEGQSDEPAAAPATEQAETSDEPAMVDTSDTPAMAATVRVDAVEIEGSQLFVAGSATPGHSVRVLADGTSVGTETVDENGRFIIEANTELSVGDHVIAAELMAPGSSEVVLRATVPFNRPAGETMAAVAREADGAAPVTEPVESADADTVQGAASETDGVESAESETDGAESAASGAQVASDPAATPDAEANETPRQDAPTEMAGVAEMPAAETPAASAEADMDDATSADTADISEPETPVAPDPGTAESDSNAVGESDAQMADATTPSAEIASAGEPATIEQAPLTPTAGSVIIRRGDTLWQIARRTYGRGVRYTTIYLANQQQIDNPDLISPGQVFKVPETPLDNAEELHRKRLQRQNSASGD